jgi:hypothetical protein
MDVKISIDKHVSFVCLLGRSTVKVLLLEESSNNMLSLYSSSTDYIFDFG